MTQIGSIITYVIALFVLYRVLVEQKDATIQNLKEQINSLKDQLVDARSQSPDVLAQNLANRIKLLEQELERLQHDKSASQEQVKAKEMELNQVRAEAANLSEKVQQARKSLSDFLCPHCGARLIEKSYPSELVWSGNKGTCYEYELTVFECGYAVQDGEMIKECSKSNSIGISDI
ncbi:hypothetical protein [Methylomonas sp. CM2]|uniref:hypothetical protein n=1 Tax=Methylomonas sp. CM2 TaxID=3417647 RepID=UPI003CF76DCB